jgi:RNA polymerase sigma-70 factor (ECF subfamily)
MSRSGGSRSFCFRTNNFFVRFLSVPGKSLSEAGTGRWPQHPAMEGTILTQREQEQHPAYLMDVLPALDPPPAAPAIAPTAPNADAALALALIRGDQRAPQQAWARYSPMVYGMLRRTFGADHRVEDLIQDVFFILFSKVRGLREPNALKAYIISITVMTIKYELRRKKTIKRLQVAELIPGSDRLTTEQPDAGARQALNGFYALLERLNETDRTAFILRFFEGLGVIEVALALKVSVSTAKRRLVRLRKRVITLIRSSPALASFLEELESDQNDSAFASRWISTSVSARL